MLISLPTIDATYNLGSIFARALTGSSCLLPIFFYGEMGMGKTTLISALVKTLPGGETAETSSPSFTLYNIYTTRPPVAHFDLYRQEDETTDESLLDFLDGERHLVLVEWAGRLRRHALPLDRLSCEIAAENRTRFVRLAAFGHNASNCLAVIARELSTSPGDGTPQ